MFFLMLLLLPVFLFLLYTTLFRSLECVVGISPENSFAIAVDDEAVGGIGFTVQHDVARRSAEIGYWLGEEFWGRGRSEEHTSELQSPCNLVFRILLDNKNNNFIYM